MLSLIRKSRIVKGIMVFMAFEMLINIVFIRQVAALSMNIPTAKIIELKTTKTVKPLKEVKVETRAQPNKKGIAAIPTPPNGPGQPEAEGPSAMNYDNYVDPFTGDFHYSIPLFNEDGIGLTLNYNAGITMEQEASWVGLGWTVNPGSINRNVRGLPDDFKEDDVVDRLNIRPNITFGVNCQYGLEVLGIGKFDDDKVDGGLTASLALEYNNYTGFGMHTAFGVSIPAGENGSIGLNMNSESSSSFGDIGISPQLKLEAKLKAAGDGGGHIIPLNVGVNYTSKEGLKAISIGTSHKVKEHDNYKPESGFSANLFADNTYTPKLQHSFSNYSLTFNGKAGLTAYTADAYLGLGGYYSEQVLKKEEKELHSKAYGYLYYTNEASGNILMDFNREKDGNIDAASPNLPLSSLTYDIYSISAPGLSGNFRAYRNDIGYIEEKRATVNSTSASLGLEFAGGLIASPGVDISVTRTNAQSETWTTENNADDLINFASASTSSSNLVADNEPVHFAMMGEVTQEVDPTFVDAIGGKEPVKFLAKDYKVTSSLLPDLAGVSESLGLNSAREARVTRTKNVSYITYDELSALTSLYPNRHQLYGDAKGHHIAEIIVTQEDGTRYVFGLPAYNTTQKEVTFNVGKEHPGDPAASVDDDNLVSYDDTQNSVENSSGTDHYFQETTTPAFVYTYLLTEILSPDYVDATGDGASDDDLGSYVKYTYGEPSGVEGIYQPNIPNFKWRTPYSNSAKQATYTEGLENSSTDDRASYMYGEKEIWYLNTIETKNYKTIFYLSDRNDAMGATENGLINTSLKQKQIDSIALFSKPELYREHHLETVVDPLTDVIVFPLKTAHFEYDYSLCHGVNTNSLDEGKLTLRKVYFTYNNSRKGKYAPYDFEYNEEYTDASGTKSFDYSSLNIDRWGNFKPNSSTVPNYKFPYVDQSLTDELANEYASAWSMTAVNLPTGGRMEIEYESDRYAYVQGMRATQMYTVTGMKEETGDTEGSELYEDLLHPHYYVYFKLPQTLSSDFSDPKGYVLTQILAGAGVTDNLYFRFKVNTNVEAGVLTDYEYISGFGTIDLTDENNYGVVEHSGVYDEGYFKLNPVSVKVLSPGVDIFDLFGSGTLSERDVNPISKAGWKFIMLNTRYNVLDAVPPGESATPASVFAMLADVTMFSAIKDIFFDPNTLMAAKKMSKQFVRNESWVRLLSPDVDINDYEGEGQHGKIGGGHRVSQITIYDNWDNMAPTEDETSYTTTFKYETDKGTCAGVAAYEPLVGSDEIPLHTPASYSHKEEGYQYDKYLERPFGESFFPSPVVGYSRVVMQNTYPTDVVRTGTGKTVYEFYTVNDFPVKVSNTELDPIIHNPGLPEIFSFFKVASEKLYTGSQGYSIELNDMHGKPKKTSVYAEKQKTATSTIEYFYKTADGSLSNDVDVISKSGSINNSEIGVTYDISVDFRKQNLNTIGGSTKLNADGFLATIVPVFIPTGWPTFSYSHEATKLAVVTKVITRSGILDHVEATEDGSKINTKNLYFDGRNGNPLITSTQNEYEEDYFSFNYPAYWMYDNMSFASDNNRLSFLSTADDEEIDWTSSRLVDDMPALLNAGDEVLVRLYDYETSLITSYQSWVYDAVDEGKKYLIDINGLPLYFDYPDLDYVTGIVIRSGKKNIIAASAGSITSKVIPVNTGGTALQVSAAKDIISARATEFSEKWQNFCTEDEYSCDCDEDPNPVSYDVFDLITGLIDNEDFYYRNESMPGQWSNINLYNSNRDMEPDECNDFYYFDYNEFISGSCTHSGSQVLTPEALLEIDHTAYSFPSALWLETRVSNSMTNRLMVNLLRDPDEDHEPDESVCDFNIEFYEDDDITPFDLTSAEAEYIFENPTAITLKEYDVPSTPTTACIGVKTFNMHLTYTYESTSKTIHGHSTIVDCIVFRHCNASNTYCSGGDGDISNPYVFGALGRWKPKANFMYLTNRNYSATSLKDVGVYNTFDPFWTYSGGAWESNEDLGWQTTATSVLQNPFTQEAENVNPLNISSSTWFGHNNTLPIMVANNASLKQIGYKNFEDDEFEGYITKACTAERFDFNGEITSDYAHTGNFSLLLPEETETTSSTFLTFHTGSREEYAWEPGFEINDAYDCLPPFSPDKETDEDVTYILTLWIKEENVSYDYDDLDLELTLGVSSLTLDGTKKSDIIEDWQRIEYTFTIPDGSTGAFEIKFTNDGPNNIYLDDIRVQPKETLAKCYAFDYRTQRLMAELDENHYATFYEYDEEGKLVRIKKETEKGIMTIQETRYNTVKR